MHKQLKKWIFPNFHTIYSFWQLLGGRNVPSHGPRVWGACIKRSQLYYKLIENSSTAKLTIVELTN